MNPRLHFPSLTRDQDRVDALKYQSPHSRVANTDALM